MKKITFLLLFFTATKLVGQTNAEKESEMKPALWLDIWDQKQANETFKITSIGYNDIPKDVFYRGTLVECLEFDDANGHHILFLTQTGKFPVSEKDANGKYVKKNDRAELYAYMYSKSGNAAYRNTWKMMDAQDCDNFDLYVGFSEKSLSITDVDGDNIAEVSFQHTKSCRSDVSPADRFLTMYQSSQKTQFIGITQIDGMPIEVPNKIIKTPISPESEQLLEEKWKLISEDKFKQFQ